MTPKTVMLASTLALVTALPAQANDGVAARQGASFVATAAAGAALGGPLGMLAGALGGAWFAEQIATAAEADRTRRELAEMQSDTQQLREQLRDTQVLLAQAE